MSATVMWWIAGALIACAALALGTWALFADRSRGRKRCPKCWYDMSGSAVQGDGEAAAALRCPECGREIKHARQLARTRRRWRWALAAMLLLLIATSCFITGKAKRDGWESVTPTTVLILIAQWSDDPWAMNLLTDRHDLWLWQARWATGVCISKIRSDLPVNIRQDAVRVLGYATEVRAMEGDDVTASMAVFSLAVQDSIPAIRMTACLYVPQLNVDWNQAAAVVTPMLNDPDRRVRRAAVLWLGGPVFSENANIDLLLAALAHRHADVRAAAASTLNNAFLEGLRTTEVVEALSHSAQLDPDPSVRENSLGSLSVAPTGVADTTPLALQGLHDPVAGVREAALVLLHAPASRADELLRMNATFDALGDPDPAVRQLTVDMLSWPEDPQLAPAFKEKLVANLGHLDPVVRAAMMQLLQHDAPVAPSITQRQ